MKKITAIIIGSLAFPVFALLSPIIVPSIAFYFSSTWHNTYQYLCENNPQYDVCHSVLSDKSQLECYEKKVAMHQLYNIEHDYDIHFKCEWHNLRGYMEWYLLPYDSELPSVK